MSRRGRYGTNFSGNARGNNRREFYQHDDRGESTGGRGSFNRRYNNNWSERNYEYGKQRGGGFKKGRGFKKPWNDDIQMSEGKDRHQQYYENARRGHRGGHKFSRQRDRDSVPPLIRSTSGWNKVIVKNGSRFDQSEVISCIKSHLEEEIIPHLYNTDQNDLSFYIEGKENLARSIMKLSGRMTLSDGQKFKILCIDAAPPPSVKMNPTQLAVVESAMSGRYSIEMARIDLKNFHNDPNLVKEKIFCPLYRQPNMRSIVEVILKNIPTVKEIDLSHNQLTNVIGLEGLLKCPNLEILNLEKNKIRNDYFSKLTGLGITELNLEGNPLCDKFKDANAYTTAIRKFFPKVIRLDGIDLPKPISFGLDDDTSVRLPPSKPSFLFSEEVKTLIYKFIEQYYQVFESGDRHPLQAAYTVDAKFSFVTTVQEASVSKESFPLMKESRNLLREAPSERRKKQLFCGHQAIVDLLCKFPKHIHDPNSFVIDIPFVQPQIMHVVLTGVFRYHANYNNRVRSFMRSLIIVPVGAGFCISNEELFFCHATPEQFEKAFKSPVQSLESTPSSLAGPSTSDPLSGLDPVKVEMVKQFSITSKMLPEFSKVCLEKNDWDFNKAGEMFLSLQNENKIPPEYFGTGV